MNVKQKAGDKGSCLTHGANTYMQYMRKPFCHRSMSGKTCM